MNKLENYTEKTFDDIKHIDEYGNEYWLARELMIVLEYSKWNNFVGVIEKAKIVCKLSNNNISDHFVGATKMVEIGSKAKRKVPDYKLSRYACYLIVQNADPNKEVVALGQTYFAIQTIIQEITEEEYANLSKDNKKLYRKKQTKDGDKLLYKIAKDKGVKNFDKFTNAGYKGLYGGETADDIAKRKGLRYREDILDNMSNEELGANAFRITQTEALLRKQAQKSEATATNTHYKVGKEIRETIKRIGGTMPEELPTPLKSLKEINEERKEIEYE